MTQQARTFRIFVSPSFSDMKAERNALQERGRIRVLLFSPGMRWLRIIEI
jgi:hypothetical protein